MPHSPSQGKAVFRTRGGRIAPVTRRCACFWNQEPVFARRCTKELQHQRYTMICVMTKSAGKANDARRWIKCGGVCEASGYGCFAQPAAVELGLTGYARNIEYRRVKVLCRRTRRLSSGSSPGCYTGVRSGATFAAWRKAGGGDPGMSNISRGQPVSLASCAWRSPAPKGSSRSRAIRVAGGPDLAEQVLPWFPMQRRNGAPAASRSGIPIFGPGSHSWTGDNGRGLSVNWILFLLLENGHIAGWALTWYFVAIL